MMSVRLCMKEIGFCCSARPQRSHGILFHDLGSKANTLNLPSFPLSPFLMFSLSLSPPLPPTHLSLYCLLCSKISLKFKSRGALSLFEWGHDTRAMPPGLPVILPSSHLSWTHWPWVWVSVEFLVHQQSGQRQSSFQKRRQSFWKSESQNHS